VLKPKKLQYSFKEAQTFDGAVLEGETAKTCAVSEQVPEAIVNSCPFELCCQRSLLGLAGRQYAEHRLAPASVPTSNVRASSHQT